MCKLIPVAKYFEVFFFYLVQICRIYHTLYLQTLGLHPCIGNFKIICIFFFNYFLSSAAKVLGDILYWLNYDCSFFQYYFAMLLIFLVLLVGAVLAFVFRDKFRQRFTSLLKDNLIITYQDDPDKQSTIDWLQEQVSILYQKKIILCKNFIVWFCSFVSNCDSIK